jgi:hypothetical protein
MDILTFGLHIFAIEEIKEEIHFIRNNSSRMIA